MKTKLILMALLAAAVLTGCGPAAADMTQTTAGTTAETVQQTTDETVGQTTQETAGEPPLPALIDVPQEETDVVYEGELDASDIP